MDMDTEIEITKLGEYGYIQSLYGLGLSYGITSNIPFDKFPESAAFSKLEKVAESLVKKPINSGEAKFLEHIQVWLLIRAPRNLWQQFDTYRISMSKQSESTMHTLMKREAFKNSDFFGDIDDAIILRLNEIISTRNFKKTADNLPESFAQSRQICTNYKTLRNIFNQRQHHRREQWGIFCDWMLKNLEHQNFIMVDKR